MDSCARFLVLSPLYQQRIFVLCKHRTYLLPSWVLVAPQCPGDGCFLPVDFLSPLSVKGKGTGLKRMCCGSGDNCQPQEPQLHTSIWSHHFRLAWALSPPAVSVDALLCSPEAEHWPLHSSCPCRAWKTVFRVLVCGVDHCLGWNVVGIGPSGMNESINPSSFQLPV